MNLDPHYGGARYYCYRVTAESGEFYIGLRLCFGWPEQDTRYFGSGSWPKWCQRSKIRLRKKILSCHESYNEARKEEAALIKEASKNPKCRNKWKGEK